MGIKLAQGEETEAQSEMQTNHCLIISHIIVLEGSGFHKPGMRFNILEAAIIFTELPVLQV